MGFGIDIEQLMSMRSSANNSDAAAKSKSSVFDRDAENAERIKMFENIENGNECRCPACMGLFMSTFAGK